MGLEAEGEDGYADEEDRDHTDHLQHFCSGDTTYFMGSKFMTEKEKNMFFILLVREAKKNNHNDDIFCVNTDMFFTERLRGKRF